MALISDPNSAVSPPGVLAIAVVFTFIVWLFAGARFWALRHNTCRRFSARWINNVGVILMLVFVSMSLLLLCYAYNMVYRMRDLQGVLVTLENQRSQLSINKADLAAIDAAEDKIGMQLEDFASATMKSSLAWRLSSTTALWLVKFSIVMVYVELWDSLTMEIQCFMYVTLWTIGLTYVVIISFLCIGMPADNWSQNKGSELPVITEYTYGAANIITNTLILTIALWSLYILKHPQSKLYAVSLLLFIGLVTLSLAIARTILYDQYTRSGKPTDQSVDIIGLVEPLVASWLACLPALRVMFRCRAQSRAEELGVRTSEIRCSGHSMSTSSGNTRKNDNTQIRGKGDTGDLERGNNSDRQDEDWEVEGGGSNVDNHRSPTPLGIQITIPQRNCGHFGSIGSAQISDWGVDTQSRVETCKGFNLVKLRPRSMTTESAIPLKPSLATTRFPHTHH